MVSNPDSGNGNGGKRKQREEQNGSAITRMIQFEGVADLTRELKLIVR